MVWSVCSKLKYKRQALTSEEIVKLDYSGELYSSLCYYDGYLSEYLNTHKGSLEGYDGKAYGHFFILDLDGPREQIALVSAAAVALMKYLDHRDVPYYAFFSGGKGYHFYIPKVYVQFEERYDGQWHRAGKQFAKQISEEIVELEPWIDFSIYDRSRQFRFPFSKYPEPYNGRESRKKLVQYDSHAKYQIGIRKCNPAEVIRNIFFGMPFTNQELDEIEPFMILADPAPEEEPSAKPAAVETVTVGEMKIPEDEKVCIYRMMADSDCEGRRHDIGLRLMAYWREKYLLPQYIESSLKIWNRSLAKPLSDDEITSMLKYRDKYTFDCDDHIKRRYCSDSCRFSKHKDREAQAQKNSEKVNADLATQIRDWVTASEGTFTIHDLYAAFLFNTRAERQNCSNVLGRLVQEGVIERHGNKKGSFRVVNDDCPEMNWIRASTVALPIKWPFGIENLVDIMPGNIIILAGESNAGKTTFLLNVVRLNMDDFDVHYFNSEMGEGEFKKRLALFDGLQPDDWKFHPYERSSDFADVIRPNGLNIIDYLELHDEFWRIGGIIREIHDKLENGICIIAIQKDPNKDFGKGGSSSIEKARLYLNMTPGKLLIKKAKSWHTEVNPNGMSLIYHVIHGSKLYSGGSWEKKVA